MVEPDRRDRAHFGTQHVRAVEPAAEPHFDHAPLHLLAGEVIERERGGHLEVRALFAARHRGDHVEAFGQHVLRRPAAVHADALAEVHEVRRREQPRPPARGAQHALDERAHGALAVRARHVHGAERLVRIPEGREQAALAVQPELVAPALVPVERLERALHPMGHGREISEGGRSGESFR